MMYGFGDTKEPDKETVELVEDMTVDFITNFAHRCMEVSAQRGKLQTDDLLYLHPKRREEVAEGERAAGHERAAEGGEEEFRHR